MNVLHKMRNFLLLLLFALAGCDKPSKKTKTVYLAEDGKQNLAKFSHGEEPYLTLIRTTQLLDHLRIKGWSLRHITQHEYDITLSTNSEEELICGTRLEHMDYPYVFVSLDEGVKIIQLSNLTSSSTSLKDQVTSGIFRTDPIPNEPGTHNLYSSFDEKYSLDITFKAGE